MTITQREFPGFRKYETSFADRPLSFETGKLAELANAAVLVKYGGTTILCTVTAGAKPRDGIDYFPLSVDFEEKLYSVGRIPGGFLRREGRPSEKAVLISRVIDRPMRPLFPSDLRNDVIIACTVLSVDYDAPPEVAAMLGASLATHISDVPWNGPIAGLVLGYADGKYLVNPTQKERETSQMSVFVAATKSKV
ncbi:MAG: polyribonucleotide nucleotidyltransferase, partial [Oscillospiraceae bacterium]|nr:polyribonucleotide nucleotidyltransferase [Oscillospiraceae bacterium]